MLAAEIVSTCLTLLRHKNDAIAAVAIGIFINLAKPEDISPTFANHRCLLANGVVASLKALLIPTRQPEIVKLAIQALVNLNANPENTKALCDAGSVAQLRPLTSHQNGEETRWWANRLLTMFTRLSATALLSNLGGLSKPDRTTAVLKDADTVLEDPMRNHGHR